jgi:anaerobic ribonucleoside-triphosphate reductase activating protein
VWCYTGYEFGTLLAAYVGAPGRRLLDYVDVLVDGPYIEAQRTLELPWRGSRNQRLIDVQSSIKAGRAVEYKEGDT